MIRVATNYDCQSNEEAGHYCLNSAENMHVALCEAAAAGVFLPPEQSRLNGHHSMFS